MNEARHYRILISSDHRVFDLHLKETFQYRDLIHLFVKRNFISRYKQTLLGPLWAVIQPLLTTVVFTVIFGNLARMTTADIPGDFNIPGFLFYMAGSICWSYFSTTVESTANTFINNRNIMGKVYFPRLVSPISTSLSNLISFFIQFVLLLVMMLIACLIEETDIHLTSAVLLLPLLVLHLIILAVGCGIIISSVTTKYRDLMLLVGFGLQLWQYASPIAYGLELVPHQYIWLYMLNPISSIVTAFRYSLFGFGYFHIGYYLLSLGISMLVFFCGLILFSRIERTFMDTI